MQVAVIPARGGSKRIPGKNIKPFFGKPMIAWSILAAQQSGVFDRIIVSTDDEAIAQIAQQYGAQVPFMRPSALSDDYTGTLDVIAHATQWLIDQGCALQALCCLYATAPFVQPDDIRSGLDRLLGGPWQYAFSVTDFAAPIFRAFKTTDEGGVQMFFPEHFTTRSQDLPEAWHDAGQFYWGRPQAWLDKQPIFTPQAAAVPIPRWRVQDIDTPADWQRAQTLAPLIMPKAQ